MNTLDYLKHKYGTDKEVVVRDYGDVCRFYYTDAVTGNAKNGIKIRIPSDAKGLHDIEELGVVGG